MSVIYCHRCDSYTDTDFEDAVVLKGKAEDVCWECLEEGKEVCEDCGQVFKDKIEDEFDVCECAKQPKGK